MERLKSWKKITDTGNKVQKNWKKIAKNNSLKINIFGLPALSAFSLESKNWLKYKTFITQEMLKKGFLASNALFICINHDKIVLENYYDNLNEIFHTIYKFEKGINSNIDDSLDSEVCHSGFNRLN